MKKIYLLINALLLIAITDASAQLTLSTNDTNITAGETIGFTWTGDPGELTLVDLVYSDDNFSTFSTAGNDISAGDNYYYFDTPADLVTGDYTFKLIDQNFPPIDASNEITVSITGNTISITSPTEGSNLNKGDDIYFSWDISDGINNLELLMQGPGDTEFAVVNTEDIYPNDDIYGHPTTDLALGAYSFKLKDANSTLESEAVNITLIDPVITATIILDTPTSGESFNTGDNIDFTWTITSGTVNTLQLWFSEDGVRYEPFASFPADDPSYTLTVPENASENAYSFRLVDAENTANKSDVFILNVIDIHFAGIEQLSPDNGTTGLSTMLFYDEYNDDNGTIQIRFKELIEVASGKTITLTDGDAEVINLSTDTDISLIGYNDGGEMKYYGMKIDLSAQLPLKGNTTYSVLIDGSTVSDLAGTPNFFPGTTTEWTFSTAPAIGGQITYTGSATGKLIVLLIDNNGGDTEPDSYIIIDNPTFPYNYNVTAPVNTTYTLFAFIDKNDDGEFNGNSEPYQLSENINVNVENVIDINLTLIDPSIEINTPTEAQQFNQGDDISVTWSTVGEIANLNLMVQGPGELDYSKVNDSSISNDDESFVFETTGKAIGQYFLKMVDANGDIESDPVSITLITPVVTATLTLDSPNGQTLNPGDSFDFTWTITDESVAVTSLYLQISEGDESNYETFTEAFDVTSEPYTFDLPMGTQAGLYYFRLIDANNSANVSNSANITIVDNIFGGVTNQYPANGAEGNARFLTYEDMSEYDNMIVVDFAEDIILEADVDITITDGGTPIIINSNDPGVSVSGSTLKIDLSPYLPLTANTNYNILIDGSSIRDNAGNYFEGFNTDTNPWSFTIAKTISGTITIDGSSDGDLIILAMLQTEWDNETYSGTIVLSEEFPSFPYDYTIEIPGNGEYMVFAFIDYDGNNYFTETEHSDILQNIPINNNNAVDQNLVLQSVTTDILTETSKNSITITKDYILVNKDIQTLQLYNATGVLVLTEQNINQGQLINTSNLTKGLYLISIDNKESIKMLK